VITGRLNGGNYRYKHPFIRVSVHLPVIMRDYVPIDFMIDTGMTYSCLHPLDTIGKIVIDPAVLTDSAQWPNQRLAGGIGGQATHYVHDAHYLFHHDDGSMALSIRTETIEIAPPTSSNTSHPSLLGMNILRYFKLRMDYVSGIVVLEP
jgi:hypothetical protein